MPPGHPLRHVAVYMYIHVASFPGPIRKSERVNPFRFFCLGPGNEAIHTCSKQNFDDKTSSLLASLYLVCSTEQGSITHQERCCFCQFWLHGSLVRLTGVLFPQFLA